MCENNFSDDYEEDYLRDVLEYCDECSIYGDDYSFDDDGEMVCNCDNCPMNPYRSDEE